MILRADRFECAGYCAKFPDVRMEGAMKITALDCSIAILDLESVA